MKARNEAATAGGGHWRPRHGCRTHALVNALRREERPCVDAERSAGGRIPPLTTQAQQRLGRAGGRGAADFGNGRADSWLDRNYHDRCITRGFPGSMMLPAIYGNVNITQAPGLVAIRYEMIHETRVIRLDEQPAHRYPDPHGRRARPRSREAARRVGFQHTSVGRS